MNLLLSHFIRRPDHVVWKVIEGKGMLLNLDDGSYFEVNSTGLLLWKKCDGRTTLENLILFLQEDFDLDSQQATKDVADFVRTLTRYKMAEVMDKPDVI